MPPSPKAMQSEAKALNMLGLAMRAGQLTTGDDMVERDARAGRAAMVLLDAGASVRTQDKYRTLCERKGIPLYLLREDTLGRSIGKDNRMIAAVKKGPMAKQLMALLETAVNP